MSSAAAALPIRAIIFDAGGTLIHLDLSFLLERFADMGVPCDARRFHAAYDTACNRLAEQLRSEKRGTDATRSRIFWDTIFDYLGCQAPARAAITAAIAEHRAAGRLWTSVEPGTAGVLRALEQQGYALGVLSNSDGRVEQYLITTGLREPLGFVVDSSRVGLEKPDPAIFRLACQRAGVEPAEALYVGDFYEVDVAGARAAGMPCLLLDPRGRQAHTDADRIRSLSELPAWLARREARAARPAVEL